MTRKHPRAGLWAAVAGDERGAIMLLALFMAVFLVAVLAYVGGIGAAVLHREQMQDAADAAAFSSAVLHARGMNVIALINMLMAALLAILVALKLVELLTTIAIVAISIAAFFAPGSAAAIPLLAELRSSVQQAHTSLRPGIHTALEAMHVAARGVRTLIPVVSQLRALDIVHDQPRSPATIGIAIPARATLPTRDGTFDELCDKAGDYVGDLTGSVIGGIGLPEVIGDVVADATSDLAKSRADWFCGSGGKPPSTKVTQRHHYPRLPGRAACEAMTPSSKGYQPDEHHRVCEQAERDESESQPDERGACVDHCDSGTCTARCDDRAHPYYVRAAAARVACAPDPDAARDDLRSFAFQLRTFTRKYAFREGAWRRLSTDEEERAPSTNSFELREGEGRPCGGPHASISPDWNDAPGADDPAPAAAAAVCTDAAEPSGPGFKDQLIELDHREVTHVFGCMRKLTKEYSVPAEAEGDQSSDSKVPQHMLDGLRLGDATFQVRSLVVGELPPRLSENMIRISTWGARNADDGLDGANLGRIAVAQAEYYYDAGADADPATFLWNMRWRARLRRFTWPSADADRTVAADDQSMFGAGPMDASLAGACDAFTASLGAASPCALLPSLSAAIVH